ncbi:hypothetical protein [Rickettsia hoogstraalii]|uniref:hypothetical protein n=1 Tax=Rickettsia hoogstraalii TaxID=467174 RepID=UPI0018CE334A|nr:hypothetical protein [Rickettsia hoogstraalii]
MRGKTVSFDEAISGYLTRLPRSLRLLAMTIFSMYSPFNLLQINPLLHHFPKRT